MSNTWTFATPVFVREYDRFRLGTWEHVDAYYRSLPKR